MLQNRQNSWLAWLQPKNTNSISPYTPSLQYVGGRSSRTGEVITPENALQNPTVFACVSFLAQTIAQLPWGVSEHDAVGFNPITNHPLQKLLKRPNKAMSAYEFKHSLVVDILTYGNTFILKVKTSSGTIVELIPLRADQMTPVLSASGRRSYRHENGTIYTDDQIIHIRDFIGSSIDGLSKVNQCANLVAIDNAIDNTLADTFRNGTAISGVVSFAENMPPDIKKAFAEGWAEKFAGNGSSKGSIAVLDNGATFTQVEPQSPADAEMLNFKQQTMTRIAAIFRVPAYAIEIADGSKYDNLSQRQSGFYRDSIAPLTKNIQQKLTEGLLDDDSLEIEFDSSEIVKGDMQTATAVAVQGVAAGLLTIDEGRDLMGYGKKPVETTPKVEGVEDDA
ncbi:MAG: phage portal protein [Acinetobacter sp.]|uniref:phage portal protein n=1 Tax=Acinetobacter sp. TaxID=472 RepID=UPI00391C2AFC